MAVDFTLSYDRACAALTGMAIGDALGMPSQTLSRAEIQYHYRTITDFVAPFADHPVAHGLAAGQVTDDTEQAFLLAELLVAGDGEIDEAAWARALLDWEADIRARGLRDLLGPSSKAALDAMLTGTPPQDAGRYGTTNGGAMRIAPVGIATALDPLPGFLDRVEQACRTTHNTGEAIAAAAAVAALISCGIAGQDYETALETALDAAREGQSRGHSHGAADMADKIAAALACAGNGVDEATFAAAVGTSVASHESVPAAFGILRLAKGDPWQAARIAANIGDDTDTIGAIAGAMAGACSGLATLPAAAVTMIRRVNDLAIEDIARQLLHIRFDGGFAAREKVGAAG